MSFFIDMTPVGCKTPEGVARSNQAVENLDNARTIFANNAVIFLQDYTDFLIGVVKFSALNGKIDQDEANEFLQALEDMDTDSMHVSASQNEFFRAVTGR